MNAPGKTTEYVTVEKSLLRREPEEDLDGGWFVQPESEIRAIARPRSVPPTGDDEVDSWLK